MTSYCEFDDRVSAGKSRMYAALSDMAEILPMLTLLDFTLEAIDRGDPDELKGALVYASESIRQRVLAAQNHLRNGVSGVPHQTGEAA